MKKLFLICLFIFPLITFAQKDHRMSAAEKSMMPSYLQRARQSSTSVFTQPPSSPVRASAEWEEIDGLMIAWTSFTDVLTGIVRAAQTETKVIIICDDSNDVKNTLTSAGVPLINLSYIIAPFNTIWCRDYGQWNIYTTDVDSLALIDWIYNRPRPKDDTIPSAIQQFTGLPMYATTTSPNDLIHTGGNFMCDGFGTGFSSKLILDENPSKTEAQIDTIMKNFMGINNYIKMDVLPYDEIHHIDMHMKLLDEETLLVGKYPAGIADGPQIEANIQYILSNYNSVFGTPYKIVRIPMPPDAMGIYPDHNGDYRTYTNSVFVNKSIILPVYDEQYDTTAIRIYKETLPGYTIYPVECNSIIPSLGAIHCITKEVAADGPLLISHQPLHDTFNTTSPYVINAYLNHRSGIQSANLYYRTDTMLPYTSVPMSNILTTTWTGNIPPQPVNTIVYYYIEGVSVSGKTQVRPMPAPAGYWKFRINLNTGITGINQNNLSASECYPNPSHGITCIPVNTLKDENITIQLKSISGEKVIDIYRGINSGEKNYFMNTTGLPAGIYLLEINSVFQRVMVY